MIYSIVYLLKFCHILILMLYLSIILFIQQVMVLIMLRSENNDDILKISIKQKVVFNVKI